MLLIILVASIILIAFFSSLLGIGGGLLYLPLFILLGYHIWEAASLAIFLTGITSLACAPIFYRNKMVSLRLVLLLGGISAAGGFLGGRFAAYIDMNLLYLFYFVYSLITIVLFRSLLVSGYAQLEKSRSARPALAGTLAFVSGILFNFTAISGSFISIPLFVNRYRIPYRAAAATSSLMLVLTAAGSLLGRLPYFDFDLRLALLCGAFVIIAAPSGAHLASKLKRKQITRLTIILQLLVIFINVALITQFLYVNLGTPYY